MNWNKSRMNFMARSFVNYLENSYSGATKINTTTFSSNRLRLRAPVSTELEFRQFHKDIKCQCCKKEEDNKVLDTLKEIGVIGDNSKSIGSCSDSLYLPAKQPSQKPLVAKLTGRFQLVFTCKKCNTRNVTHISKISYQQGVVIVCCQGCKVNHLIADNLKWFSDKKVNVEDMLAEKGESVTKITNHEVFLEVVPPDTPDPLQKEEKKTDDNNVILA